MEKTNYTKEELNNKFFKTKSNNSYYLIKDNGVRFDIIYKKKWGNNIDSQTYYSYDKTLEHINNGSWTICDPPECEKVITKDLFIKIL